MQKLNKVLSTNRLPRVVVNVRSTYQINKCLDQHWNSIFGKLAKDITLLFYKKNVLYIGCENPLWVTEIDYYKPKILKKIQEVLKHKTQVKDLKTRYVKEQKQKKIKVQKKDRSKSLAEKIKLDLEEKIKKGHRLCTKCEKSYIKKEEMYCVFCKNSTL